MSWIDRFLKQTSTYWTTTPSGRGDYAYGTPSSVISRWEDRRVVVRDGTGEHLRTETGVILNFKPGANSYLYLGSTSTANPTTLLNARKVERTESIPDIRAGVTLYRAILE